MSTKTRFKLQLWIATVLMSLITTSGLAQQKKERMVKQSLYRNQPVEIVGVKIKGVSINPKQKFNEADDWLDDVAITLKNTISRPIAYVSILVTAPHVKADGTLTTLPDGEPVHVATQIVYGIKPSLPDDPSPIYVVPLQPNETVTLKLGLRSVNDLFSLLRERNSSIDISELTLRVYEVCFEGDAAHMWSAGTMLRRDPKNPQRWVPLEPRSAQISLLKKNVKLIPARLTAKTPMVLFSEDPGVGNCTRKDEGTTVKDCTALDSYGKKCKWDDRILTTNGPEWTVKPLRFDKYCYGSIPGVSVCLETESHLDYIGDGDCTPVSTPLVLDIAGDGIDLTNTSDGVRFDLNSNGIPELISWTSYDSDDAWLVLDRNGNGNIDNGTEMFGNYTPQSSTWNPNGFLALAEYDKAKNGGNGDGVINKQDAIFSRLRLWQDVNHNGISEPNELHKIPALNVKAISLDYKGSRRTDEYGNIFRYRAKVTSVKTSNVGPQVWDVFLLVKP